MLELFARYAIFEHDRVLQRAIDSQFSHYESRETNDIYTQCLVRSVMLYWKKFLDDMLQRIGVERPCGRDENLLYRVHLGFLC